jgi:hypothetical protein
VDRSQTEDVRLALASSGAELWPAIEAGQYARLVMHDPPRSAKEEGAIEAFVEAFCEITESWEAVPDQNKSVLLESIGRHVQGLQALGVFIHCGCVERLVAGPAGTSVPLPLAVLSVDHTDAPTATVSVPIDMNMSEEDEGT